MIISKQAQEKLVYDFLQDHTVKETEAFSKGMEAAFNLVHNIMIESQRNKS